MAKKNRNQNPSQSANRSENYNVRENLGRLRSGSDSYSTQSQTTRQSGRQATSDESSPSLTSAPSLQADKVDALRDSVTGQLTAVHHKIDTQRESYSNALKEEMKSVRAEMKNFEDKTDKNLSEKVSNLWFGAAIAVLLVIAGIIYALSYSEIVSDVKGLKDGQNELQRKMDKCHDQEGNAKKSNEFTSQSADSSKSVKQKEQRK